MSALWVFILSHLAFVASQQITMDSNNKFNVSWMWSEKEITFNMTVETTGWVALGFSPNGGMSNADIVIGWVSNGELYVEDYYASSAGLPRKDSSQDITPLSGSEENGLTTISFSRKINTCDKEEDRKMESGTTRLIYAYGLTDPANNELSSADKHATSRRGAKSAYLLEKKTSQSIPIPDDAETYEMLTNAEIPSDTTTYYCTFFHPPNITAKHHVVAYEPVITTGNEGFVHHIIAYGCWGNDKMHLVNSNKTEGVCYSQEMPEFADSCRTAVFGWAIGGTRVNFPEYAGFSIGDESAPDFYMMEMHYDNPDRVSGRMDYSGIRLFYTPTLRENEIGVLSMGSVHGIFVPPQSDSFTVHGYCFGSCTENWIPSDGINLFSYFLHSHLLGTGVEVRLYRDGKDQGPIAQDLTYDFNFQESRFLPEEKPLLPGDTLKVSCVMKSERNQVTYGGLATTDEMCLAFMYYYPKQNISQCSSVPSHSYDKKSDLWTALNKEPSQSQETYEVDVGTVLDGLTWNDENRRAAQSGYDSERQISLCSTLNNVAHKSNHELYDVPVGKKFEVVKDDTCGPKAGSPTLIPTLVTHLMAAYWLM